VEDAESWGPACGAAAHRDLLSAAINRQVFADDQLGRRECDVESGRSRVVAGIVRRYVENDGVAGVGLLDRIPERASKKFAGISDGDRRCVRVRSEDHYPSKQPEEDLSHCRAISGHTCQVKPRIYIGKSLPYD